MSKNISVVAISNLGEKVVTPVSNQTEATKLAKCKRVTANHMVCIDVDDMRHSRWDRDRIEGENRWSKTDPVRWKPSGSFVRVRKYRENQNG